MEKVINDYEIKEIALNPAYLANDDLKNLKNQGFCVRWMRENEGSDKNIYINSRKKLMKEKFQESR